jgi:glycosyltransferase involved in cell wall biosynthesis
MNASGDPPSGRRPLVAEPQRSGARIPVLLVESGRTVGGTERVVFELARRLDRERFQPYVALAPGAGLDALAADVERTGVAVERLPEMTNRLQLGRALSTLRFLGRQGRALLHVHHVWPAADRYLVPMARMARVPVVVVTEHLVGLSHSRAQRWLKRRELTTADEVVCVSQAVKDGLERDYGADTVRAARVIVNGVDAQGLAHETARARDARRRLRGEMGMGDDAFAWLFVGRLEHQKGLDVLLAAAARMYAAGAAPTLWIVGDGTERAALEAAARGALPAGAVRFVGAVADPAPWYWAADGFVLPSRFEGLPLALLEAQAAGLPVVAADAGGVREGLADGVAGRIVPREDAAALAGALAAVASDRAKASAMGAAGARRAHDEWEWERMVGAYEAVYERAWRRVFRDVVREGIP